MEGYRVRRGGTERLFADAARLRAAASRGEIRPGDELFGPDGWVRADTHPALKGALAGADPWSAWSDVDTHDADSVYKQMLASAEPEELPAEALKEVEEPRPVASPARVEPLPEQARPEAPRAPVPDPVVAPGSRPPVGELIEIGRAHV